MKSKLTILVATILINFFGGTKSQIFSNLFNAVKNKAIPDKFAEPAKDGIMDALHKTSRAMIGLPGAAQVAVVNGITDAITSGSPVTVQDALVNGFPDAGASAVPGATQEAVASGVPNSITSGMLGAAQDAVINGITDAITSGSPIAVQDALVNVLPDAEANVVPGATHDAIGNEAPDVIASELPAATQGAVASGVPDSITSGMLGAAQNVAVNGMANGLPDGPLNAAPQAAMTQSTVSAPQSLGVFSSFLSPVQIFGGLADKAKNVVGEVLPSGGIGCKRDVTQEYQKANFDFTMRLYKRVAFYNKDHFAISPSSIWISLAALAEGAQGILQRELFAALNLPEERCLREKYYKIALTRETSGNDVRFSRKRLMIMDQGLRVNNTWANYVKALKLLDLSFAPIRSNPQAVASQLRNFIGTRGLPHLVSNSALIDSLSYEGLWTTAFPEAQIKRAPFYDDAGIIIGNVDYLKIKKRVKLAYIPLVDAKLLELPVGNDGRYKMMIVIGLSKESIRSRIEMFVNTIIAEILSNLKESLIPLEVVIPRFLMNFEFEAGPVLDEIGVGSLWKNPDTTWLLSYPPAQPSGLYQRVSIKVDSPGLQFMRSPNILNPFEGITNMASEMATGLAAAVGRDFIANRPFMYGLFDTETMTCIFAGAYSQPEF